MRSSQSAPMPRANRECLILNGVDGDEDDDSYYNNRQEDQQVQNRQTTYSILTSSSSNIDPSRLSSAAAQPGPAANDVRASAAPAELHYTALEDSQRRTRADSRSSMNPAAGTAATTTTGSSSQVFTTTAGEASSPPRRTSSRVNPASIPTRTSSTNAVAYSDLQPPTSSSSSTFSPKSPRKYRSMASVPEAGGANKYKFSNMDEREWMSPSRQNRYTLPATAPTTTTGSPPPQIGQVGQSPPPIMKDLSRSVSSPSGGKGSATTAAMAGLDAYQDIGANMTSGYPPAWSGEKEKILKGPFDYLESHPGKDVRSQMITAFNAWLQVPPETLKTITGIITMLHTASLLIDDVEDNSQLRRGVPVAHSIFGTAQTINSANYIYFCALQQVLALADEDKPAAIQIYTEELLNLHRGQGMDLFWRDTLTCPSEDDYLEMVGNKTGGLFRLAIKLMCAASPTQQPGGGGGEDLSATYIPLVNTIGLLFQILDDYRNLSDTTYTANKGLCEDLTEGKFSFPVIHAIRADPANLVLINILKQKTNDDEVKRYAVAYMERCGSFTYTRRVLRGLTRRALELVEEVDNGRGLADGVRGILEKLRVERHSRGSSAG